MERTKKNDVKESKEEQKTPKAGQAPKSENKATTPNPPTPPNEATVTRQAAAPAFPQGGIVPKNTQSESIVPKTEAVLPPKVKDFPIDLDAPIWFKKIGGGSLRLRISGKPQIIPPGQKFKARPSEIPASFKDVVLPLEQIPTAETQKAVYAGKTPVFTKSKYEPKDGETFEQEMFNIVNATGKVLNQTPLTEADADALLKDML